MGRRGKTARHEPNFDVEGPNRELRAEPDDRLPSAADEPRPKPKRKRKSPAKKAAADTEKKPARSRSKRRSLIGRAVYWGAVLALWGVIGLIGLGFWVGAQLSSSQ